jgi:hypothetical protein
MTGGEGGGAALGRQNQELQNSGIFVDLPNKKSFLNRKKYHKN